MAEYVIPLWRFYWQNWSGIKGCPPILLLPLTSHMPFSCVNSVGTRVLLQRFSPWSALFFIFAFLDMFLGLSHTFFGHVRSSRGVCNMLQNPPLTHVTSHVHAPLVLIIVIVILTLFRPFLVPYRESLHGHALFIRELEQS